MVDDRGRLMGAVPLDDLILADPGTRVEEIFSEAGVEVTTMDDAAFDEWQKLAEKQWEAFATSAPNGQELLDLAKEASGE